ncbi:uncharacterized protein EI90DRAFT_3291421 [Cantharellus anzutake]|uniref:uncharacterized protein n=1 Tax=Cantharellus anzutake TaxID=1750568 RepID=UPI001904D533|nr:uncharacterized protein EI90DRAFT_3291421 [Cantharellus anzutake]KAF8326376.1 hypothetical protein EI90DRAFT_3291421 [Cantharellus anzutake]
MSSNIENTNIPEQLQAIKSALEATERPFFCTGNIPLDENVSITILLSETSGESSPKFTPVSFPLKNESEIVPLINASSQASFGKGKEDVFDPSYRRALVLQKENFGVFPAGSLDPYSLGIITYISKFLLPSNPHSPAGQMSDDENFLHALEADTGRVRIIACLDKLNVYSTGDFFKGHIDTPRSSDMFGTLLINLPARHEGGQLVVRAPGTESSNNSLGHEEYTTQWGSGANLEWIAFFSDCEHEVLPVTSGHRVTLSYTLSFDSTSSDNTSFGTDFLAESGSNHNLSLLYHALTAPSVFTNIEHPRLCFYLEHQYPMDGALEKADSVSHKLKGRDAVLYHMLIQTGVSITFHHVLFAEYHSEHRTRAILPRSAKLHTWGEMEGGVNTLIRTHKGRSPGRLGIIEVNGNPKKFVKVDFVAYGNEASLETAYGTVCMVTTVRGFDVDEPWRVRHDYHEY